MILEKLKKIFENVFNLKIKKVLNKRVKNKGSSFSKKVVKKRIIKKKPSSALQRKKESQNSQKKAKKALPRAKSVASGLGREKKTSRQKTNTKKVIKKEINRGIKKTPSTAAKKRLTAKSDLTKEILVGDITHYFSRIQVAVLKVTNNRIILGDKIRFKGKKNNFTQKVESLQVESLDVKLAKKGQMVGLQVMKKVDVGDHVYKILQIIRK